ncbi:MULTISPECIES: alpha/beta hydrolase [Rhizobium/Agrobacterium group]|uniref:Phospholipase/carboxylesterase/thioesterase domain-containing protein n=2 Tax=Rhizobium/Agrobacterium group TaxID=227290 RepID=B9K276_ALLAM|nr:MULTISPECIES: alpha/beta hydrolase [Rhizobium/Agrobacterium group]ACM38974.1 conserved hypothetical protein [Allorhizobium ampelinum S4]MCF1449692.1 alpha/beta hydrolase [Allorhizobium ampelinum]MUO31123.1 alpha/beta hydrolase [Agrobacterium vitis]MUO44553.1 alpha/beta hydrolase [Agrobacterium vitis]MUP12669.1 alpha/beta hydrolase [Agrobacterium vitis]
MTHSPISSFIHQFVPATVPNLAPLLLLHGTGGNENDLLSLGAALSPGAALLSPRGQVLEHGMPRFFRRLAEGVFDEDDLRVRAADLAGFIKEARAAHNLAAPVAVGFSNGANIAAALLLLHRQALAGAVLLRAMTPFKSPPVVHDTADGVPVLILSGAMDPIVPADNAERLVGSLQAVGHTVSHEILPSGHNLTQLDLSISKQFLDTNFAPAATT